MAKEMFSQPFLHPMGDPNPRALVIKTVNSPCFLMGDDGRSQSKENKVLMAKQAAVMGIPMQGQAASPTKLRAALQDGDGRRSRRDLPWPHPAWPWLRAEERGAARWGMTARAKEIGG